MQPFQCPMNQIQIQFNDLLPTKCYIYELKGVNYPMHLQLSRKSF